MTSQINANNIDASFPVAGVDNDSQGFRTNFASIKTALAFAKSEISDLQDKALLKSALNNSTLDNNLNGALLRGALIQNFSEKRVDLSVIAGGTLTLDHQLGSYHQATTGGNFSVAFTHLPAAGTLGRMRLELTVANTAHVMTLPVAVSLGVKGIAGYSSATNTVTFSETGVYIFEFTTDDAGATIHITDFTRPRNYFHSNYIRLISRTITNDVGSTGDVAGMLAVDTSTPAIWLCTGSYDGSTAIWRKTELETVSNEKTVASNVTTTSNTLSNVTNLSFVADSGVTYRFDAYIPFKHSDATTSYHTYSVHFTSGTCYATLEHQAGPTSAPAVATITTDNATLSNVQTTSSSIKMCRITGTYTAPTSLVAADRTVTITHATSAGTLTTLAGAYLRFNRV